MKIEEYKDFVFIPISLHTHIKMTNIGQVTLHPDFNHYNLELHSNKITSINKRHSKEDRRVELEVNVLYELKLLRDKIDVFIKLEKK